MNRAFHTFLVALLPVVQIMSVNSQMVSASDSIEPLFVSFGIGVLVWLAFSLILKSIKAGALPATTFLLLFYLYTPLQLGLLDNGLEDLSRNSVLFLVCTSLVVVAFFYGKKKLKMNQLSSLTQKLNVFSIIVFLLPALSLVFKSESNEIDSANPLSISSSIDKTELPNIYWIVLDAYGRQDVLEKNYLFDNSRFINELEQRGFSVAQKALSNYSQTSLSLASSLNGQYLDSLIPGLTIESQDRRVLTRLIRQNNLSKVLKGFGYSKLTFSTGYALTEDPQSDRYFGSRHFLGRNPITGLLLKRTPIRILSDRLILPTNGFSWHRDRVLDNFQTLRTLSKVEAPFFAFAHILSPHKPYIFSKTGEVRIPDAPFSLSENIDYGLPRDSLYIEQLQFINEEILKALDSILQNESIKPIIVIQSDHGPEHGTKVSRQDRMSILNAIYLQGQSGASPSSPVNTSRLLLNHLFGSNLDMLDDQHYWSSYDRPFEFVAIDR